MPLMTRMPVVPFRWVGHGIDLRAYVDGAPLFFATDVCVALEITVEMSHDRITDLYQYRWPVAPTTIDGLLDDDGQPTALLATDQVLELARNNTSYLTTDFLTWFEGFTADLDTAQIEDALQRGPAASEILAVAGGITYSVRRAALILSADPVINLGQTALFECLRAQGWIDRVNGWWRAAQQPVRDGWLIVQPRKVPGRRDLYPQVRITPTGLSELHRLLGAVRPLLTDNHPHLTLVDL